MAFSWKFLQIFLAFYVASGECRLSIETSMSTVYNPTYYVSKLINDWNQKYDDVSQVAVFDIGRKSDVTTRAVKLIAKDHPVIFVGIKKCPKMVKRDSNFVLIITDTFLVSALNFACNLKI